MASLYKRATKEQERMLRIVAGAVRNTMHAHGMEVDYRFARSVAKRAVGTLTAHVFGDEQKRAVGTLTAATRSGLATSAEDGQTG